MFDNDEMDNPEQIKSLLNMLGRSDISPRQKAFIEQQEHNAERLGRIVKSKIDDITQLKEDIRQNYEPSGRGAFLEVGKFDGYNSLQFFYSLGEFLDKTLTLPLERLSVLPRVIERVNKTHLHSSLDLNGLMEKGSGLEKITKESLELLTKGILPFEQVVQLTYKRAIDQVRYLQKRFQNIGNDDSRTYRAPWEDDDQKGFDYNRVPYVKIELIENNPLFTDLLLDIAENLPKRYTKKEKVKGKRKPKETKYTDHFEVERTARILLELSEPTYHKYIRQPRTFLEKIANSIKGYYEIMSSIQPAVMTILDEEGNNPRRLFEISGRDLNQPIINPSPLLFRLEGINYASIIPSEEDTKPSGQNERNYFAARKRLLNHLAEAIDAINNEKEYDKKYTLAKSAVETGIVLKEKANKALETRKTTSIKKDKKDNNEFYVGVSGQHGEFGFEREPAPAVKLKHVYGKSFDEMKQHIEDLATYSKYLHLYGATAPRGKIRSNLIAIGPYGCGKTEIGRAIGGDPRFIGADVTVTDAVTMWFGEFEKNVDRIWDAARDLRLNSGDNKLVFLLMDEFDSWFGAKNGHWVDNTYKRVQKAIQIKLDGVVDYEGIITVGFTNEPSKIPLAIYRRFKYVDVVGELVTDERIELMRHFLTAGLPLSRGFKKSDYQKWGEILDGATGDVIGKIVDDIHYEFMRQFIKEHSDESRQLNNYIRRQSLNSKDLDKAYIKRNIGQHLLVTPDWVDQKVKAKLNDPIILEQISTAKKVYAEAHHVLANLHKREDDASGIMTSDESPEYQIKQNHKVI